jgi:2-oxoglutarate ferredoxin oxidoreductase subunit alpha
MPKDIANVKPGGYFIYDSTKELYKDFIRDDIHYLGITMMQMCMDKFADPRQRQLLKNMVYVGALSALLDIELEVLQGIITQKFKGKEKLVTANFEAMEMGIQYARQHFTCPFPEHRVERRDNVKDWIMMDGNSACGLGAVYAGATVLSWYPITPSTSLADSFGKYAKKYRIDPETGQNNFAIVQAEDELAAIGMVIGANWNGARSFTANPHCTRGCTTRRPQYRDADPYPAIRYFVVRVCFAWRYQAGFAVPKYASRVFFHDGRCV